MIYMLPFESSQYWKGNIKGVDMKDVEVLSDSAEVVSIVDEDSDRLQINDTIIVTDEKIQGALQLYFNTESGAKIFTHDEVNEFVKTVKTQLFTRGVKITERIEKGKGGKNSDSYYYSLNGILKKNSKYKISGVKTSLYNKRDEYSQKRYTQITLNFYLGKQLYTRAGLSPLFRFNIGYGNDTLHDVGKYLKVNKK